MIFATLLPKSGEYIEYNGRPLNLLGYTTIDVKVEKKTIKKARVVIARECKKSLVGQDWLAKLNFRVAESNKTSEYNSSMSNINIKPKKTEKSVELKRLERKFPKIFTRQGRIVGHTNLKKGQMLLNKRDAHSHINCKKQLMLKKSLMKAGRIERINKITDEMFFQPGGDHSQTGQKCQISVRCQIIQQCQQLQMPNLESLMEKVAEVNNGKQAGKVWLTSRDMLYEYGQTILHSETAKLCKFQNLEEKQQASTHSEQATTSFQQCHQSFRK